MACPVSTWQPNPGHVWYLYRIKSKSVRYIKWRQQHTVERAIQYGQKHVMNCNPMVYCNEYRAQSSMIRLEQYDNRLIEGTTRFKEPVRVHQVVPYIKRFYCTRVMHFHLAGDAIWGYPLKRPYQAHRTHTFDWIVDEGRQIAREAFRRKNVESTLQRVKQLGVDPSQVPYKYRGGRAIVPFLLLPHSD